MKRQVTYIFLLLFSLLMWSEGVSAQVIHISGNVSKTMRTLDGKGESKEPLSVPVYIFDNKKDARAQANLYRQKGNELGGVVNIKSNDIVTPDYDGHFEADVSVNGALVVTNEGQVKIIEVKGTLLNYDITFSSGVNDAILLKGTNVYAKRMGMNFREQAPLDDGPNMHWNVSINLPEYYAKKHARLIFQPVAVDVETKDTVQYLEPMVFEGRQYHNNQIRRKSYDYNRNDSLAPYFDRIQRLSTRPVQLEWAVTYPKPDPEKSYKWAATLSMEDYTHVYFRDNKEGTSNSRKPWQMLDLAGAASPMDLTPRFFEQVRARLQEVPRDIKLFFVVGTDQLTNDSVNQRTLDMLVEELRSYGRSLMSFSIQGGASPEGGTDYNKDLARRRAQKILNIIGTKISSADLVVKEPHVYTWEDVADSLIARGQKTEAEELLKYGRARDVAGWRRMMASNPVINQIMERQRLIKSTYTIRRNKVLDPAETMWTYYNDPRYAVGGTEVFSNGDYYNLFTQIKDSAELRKLTFRAYNENKVRKTYKYSPFAAYIANRVACYLLNQDSTDVNVLAPFIDMRAGVEVSRPIAFDNSYNYTVNYKEIIANQALMFLRKRKLGEAAFLANKLPDTGKFHDLKMLIDLQSLFFKLNKTQEEEARAQEALAYAMNSSAVNRAVLSTQLAPELGYSYKQIEPLVDSLPDNLAKKWYLKGIITANDPDMDNLTISDLIDRYGGDTALKLQANDAPDFLAYFQHSFDMDSTFQKYYATDANIGDDVRRRYPYKEANIASYRERFKLLTGEEEAQKPEETDKKEAEEAK